ncbi:arsenic resistance protein [Desulfurobacterium atlanticum]|uniref:Arsenite efflux pump ArsB, ACR3 family n=1 Tax=Desulfurobacterium atlanticum TaxID=240169 RepID=A0A238YBP1_9BACT|nr:bile acid:sodium symporter [Desulfurobacterium atlanticum]SNR68382.1 Arsenite efflux pump ArsB, ACR3 family [Desulfurobacterium atlanticum]
MKLALKYLKFIKENVPYFIIAAIVAGLINVYITGGWKIPKILILSVMMFLVILPVMINLKIDEVLKHLKEPKVLFLSLLINFTVSPFIAYILGKLFFHNHPELFIALMTLSFIPTSAMTAAWTNLAGGKIETAMFLIPSNLLFSAFVAVPFILPHLISSKMEISSLTFIKSILIVFFIPMIIGIVIRKFLIKSFGIEKFNKEIKPELSGISSVGIVILSFLVLSLSRTKLLFTHPEIIPLIVFPLIIYYTTMIIISTIYANLLVKKNILKPEEAIVVAFASAVRHLNITLAVILITFPVEKATLMVLFVILGFIIQIPLLGFYVKHYAKKFVTQKNNQKQFATVL